MKVHGEVSEQSTGNSRKHGTDDERHHLVPRCIHAHGFGGDFVVANRDEGASVARLDDIADGHDRDQHEKIDPEEITELRDSRKTARPANGVDVEDEDSDDFAEAEGDDGEVVAAKT